MEAKHWLSHHLAAQLLYIFQIEFLKAKNLDLKYCISTKSAAKHGSISSIWVLLGHDVHTRWVLACGDAGGT